MRRISGLLGRRVAPLLPSSFAQGLAHYWARSQPHILALAMGPRLNLKPDLDNMAFDCLPNGNLGFEHLAGLFSSTAFDHGVISMTVRQAAYLYNLVRSLTAPKVIEVGRYKGGGTLLIAAAMRGNGQFWSIDIGEKEARLRRNARPYDTQLRDVLDKFGLSADLIVGDSRTLEIDTGEVDLVVIDGDHSYEGVKSDFDRFGRRVYKKGGHIVFDDAFKDEILGIESSSVGKLVSEIIEAGEYELTRKVDRMAHFISR